MSGAFSSLVSTHWLADRLGASDLTVFDASLHLPNSGRDPRAEFVEAAIPGAQFLDLAALHKAAKQAIKAGNPLPIFAGAERDARIVLYDDSALRSSARMWHLLRAMGFVNVAILDGGLSKWREEQRELGAGDVSNGMSLDGGNKNSPAFLSKGDMLRELDAPTAQILDARAADRVFGTGTDPVHGGANGRIPGSLNLPFDHVFNADGTYKSPDALRLALETAGLDLARPIITSCGSGITASVLLFALHLVGVDNALLYDGSWAEWSANPNTPKAQGPA